MDTNEIIERIKEKWRGTDNSQLVNHIDILIASGSTGGEIIGLLGRFLNDLKECNHPAYIVARDLVNDYLTIWEKIPHSG